MDSNPLPTSGSLNKPQGIGNIPRQVPKLLQVAAKELPAPFGRLIERLLAHLKELDRQARDLEEQIVDWHEISEPSRTCRSGAVSIVVQLSRAFRPAAKELMNMNTTGTYLAIFLGSKNSQRRAAWDALPQAERRAKEQEGMAAWKAWADKHQSAIVAMGGPLGKTKKVSQTGLSDISNQLGAFTVVRADSHEAAARMFEKHPHFMIFPGDAIEVMPVLTIPGG